MPSLRTGGTVVPSLLLYPWLPRLHSLWCPFSLYGSSSVPSARPFPLGLGDAVQVLDFHCLFVTENSQPCILGRAPAHLLHLPALLLISQIQTLSSSHGSAFLPSLQRLPGFRPSPGLPAGVPPSPHLSHLAASVTFQNEVLCSLHLFHISSSSPPREAIFQPH